MSILARLNKAALSVYARTLGWLLLFALFPAFVYSYTHSIWMGVKIFLLFAFVSGIALLYAFWSVLFPKQEI